MLAVQEICDRPGLLDIEQALARVLAWITPIEGIDDLALHEATGRITIDPSHSAIPMPPFDQSAVDGYAVLDRDLAGSRRRVEARRPTLPAGSTGKWSLNPGETVKLLTGAPIPAGVRAVVMEEKVRFHGRVVIIDSAIEPGMNIRRRGEDVERVPRLSALPRSSMLAISRYSPRPASTGLPSGVACASPLCRPAMNWLRPGRLLGTISSMTRMGRCWRA